MSSPRVSITVWTVTLVTIIGFHLSSGANCNAGPGGWKCANHGQPAAGDGIAEPGAVTSAVTEPFKLFMKSLSGKYWQRWSTGGAWQWQQISTTDNPGPRCTAGDDNIFTIHNDGSLRHLYKSGSGWVWHNHGAPGDDCSVPKGIKFRPICWGTKRSDGASVFLVDTLGRLWERYWSNSVNIWMWAYHETPNDFRLNNISPSGRVVGNQVEIFGAQATGARALIRRQVPIGAPRGTGTWTNHGCPPGNKQVNQVQVAPEITTPNQGKVFALTTDGYICFLATTGGSVWDSVCKKIPDSNYPNHYWAGYYMRISQPVKTTSGECSITASGGTRYSIFVRGWRPSTASNHRGAIWHLQKSGGQGGWAWTTTPLEVVDPSKNWDTYHEHVIGLKSGTCPKAFFSGDVDDELIENYL